MSHHNENEHNDHNQIHHGKAGQHDNHHDAHRPDEHFHRDHHHAEGEHGGTGCGCHHGGHDHDDPHVKVAVRYIGRPDLFEHTYSGSEKVLKVKTEALKYFGIAATLDQYCLQFEDKVLNDAFSLREAGVPTGERRMLIELVAVGSQDTDGDCNA